MLAIASSVISLRKLSFLKGKLFLSSNNHLKETWWEDAEGNYIELCHAYKEFSIQLLKHCLGKERAVDKHNLAFVIGDSNARNYVSAVKAALPEKDVRYLTMGHGCAFLPINLIDKTMNEQLLCSEYVEEVKLFLQENATSGDFIFIGQSIFGDHKVRASKVYFDHIISFANSFTNLAIPVIIFLSLIHI